jgi:Carboxypeptidase regulatory-like domain
MKQEIRIASPCLADWDRMEGDEHVRYCRECKLDVYDFSEMSETEIERIIVHREGRLCARFYRRSDGTMMTQNCPAGLRAVMRRVSNFASATLAALISVSPGFLRAEQTKDPSSLVQIAPVQRGISLVVVDITGAVIPNARVTIVNEKTKEKVDGKTDTVGVLRLANLSDGKYEITVVVLGFKTLKQSHISVPARIPLRVQLDVGATMGVVVVVPANQPETKDCPSPKTVTNPPSEKPR